LVAALIAPSAEHGSRAALLDNRALALGSALNGGKDSALLTPGVSGLRLGTSLEHSRYPFAFRASLDLPLLVRISEASLPPHAETNVVGLSPALDLRGALWVTSWFGASLGGSLITEPWRIQEPALERDRKRRLQAILEAGLHVRLSRYVVLALDGSVPAAGNLGGDAWSIRTQARFGL
jgi:hypothetical protein